MIKDIRKKEKSYRVINTFMMMINITGLMILLYFAIPYVFHINSLNSYSWETCGFIIVLGFIPLLIINTLGYIFIESNKKRIKILMYIPSIICLILSCLYLVTPTIPEKEKANQIATFRCYSNDTNKYYFYNVIKENDKLIVKKQNINDKIDLSKIDTTSIESIDESLESYYKKHNGFCP